jgi:hypothetical protein
MSMDQNLFTLDNTSASRMKRVKIDVASNGNNTIVAATTGKKIRVYQLLLMANGTVNATFQSAAGGTSLSGPMPLAINTGFASGWCPVGHLETAAGELLNLSLSAPVQVSGWLVYALV